MKMKRKSLALTVSAVMLFGILAGCSSNNNNASNSPAASGTSANATAIPQKKTKLVFWDKSEYVKDYNDMQKARIDEFSKQFNVEVEYVALTPADVKTKLLASIEGGNPPDLVLADDFVAKQFVANNQLIDVAEIMKQFDIREEAKKYARAVQGYYEIPYYFMPNVMYVRKDKLDAKNLTPPKTWEEVKNVAKAINDPKNNFYGAGFQLGTGGDSEGRLNEMIRAYGGNLINDKAEVTINSPAALEALKLDASFFKEKLAPDSAITGDDGWNNSAYLAGTIGMTLNSSSLMAAMKKDKPDLAKNTIVMPYPAGPKAQFGSGGGTAFMMFANAKNTDNAKKLIQFLFDKNYYPQLIEKLNGLAVPALNGFENTAFWQKPENKGWYDATKNIVPLGDPGPPDARASRVMSEGFLSKGVQDIVLNNQDPQKVLDKVEKSYKSVYQAK
jgi:multiple sugar transport system substrate-binding protein